MSVYRVSRIILVMCFVVCISGCGEKENDTSGSGGIITRESNSVESTVKAEAAGAGVVTGKTSAVQSTGGMKEKLFARLKGRPALLIFSMRTCCGGDMSEAIAGEIASAYSDVLHTLYIDALWERELALECKIETLPTVIFYDAEGKEKERIQGGFSMEEIETMLKKNGISKKKEEK
jgi:thioredoxin 1